MADPLYDLMNAGQVNPQMRAWDYLGPNAMSLLQGRPDTRTVPTNAAPGKIPYMEDPRIGGSILEALMATGSAVPAGRAVMGAGMAGRAIPELAQSLPVMPAKATAAGGATLAAILGGGDEAGAGEQSPFTWTDTNQDRVKRIQAIDAQINQLGNRTPGGKNAAVQKVQAQGLQNRIDALNAEKNGLLEAQKDERNNALQVYESERQKADEEARAKKSAETSLLDKVPGTRAAIVAASPYASYKFGKFLGSRMSPAVSVPVSAGIGGLSGIASTAGQNELDLLTLPRTSPTRQEAQADLTDPSFYARAGLAGVVSGAFGVKGATKGYAGTLPDRTLPNKGQTPLPTQPQNTGSGGTTPGASGTTPAPIPKKSSAGPGSYVTYTTESGGKVVETPHGWRGINPETGKQTGFIKRPEGPLQRLMKSE